MSAHSLSRSAGRAGWRCRRESTVRVESFPHPALRADFPRKRERCNELPPDPFNRSASLHRTPAHEARFDGSFHRYDRMDRGRLCRHRRRQHLHRGVAAQYLQLFDPRLLRYRAHAARHPDLLGHRRDQLSRRPHHRRSGLGQCRAAIPALDRRVRDAGAAVRGDGADLDAVRQGARHLQRQCRHLRHAACRPGRSSRWRGPATSPRCC